MFPSAAGEYEYTRQALPEWVAFVVGWTMIMGLVVAAATVSIGFARYVGYFVDIDARVAALGLLTRGVGHRDGRDQALGPAHGRLERRPGRRARARRR